MAGKLVRDLTAELGLRPADLLGEGSGFGRFTSGPLPGPVSFVSGTYRWDVHHEAPVDSPDDLVLTDSGDSALPVSGGREVEAWLDGYPTGEEIPDAPPVTARYQLGPGDRIRHVDLRRSGGTAAP